MNSLGRRRPAPEPAPQFSSPNQGVQLRSATHRCDAGDLARRAACAASPSPCRAARPPGASRPRCRGARERVCMCARETPSELRAPRGFVEPPRSLPEGSAARAGAPAVLFSPAASCGPVLFVSGGPRNGRKLLASSLRGPPLIRAAHACIRRALSISAVAAAPTHTHTSYCVTRRGSCCRGTFWSKAE